MAHAVDVFCGSWLSKSLSVVATDQYVTFKVSRVSKPSDFLYLISLSRRIDFHRPACCLPFTSTFSIHIRIRRLCLRGRSRIAVKRVITDTDGEFLLSKMLLIKMKNCTNFPRSSFSPPFRISSFFSITLHHFAVAKSVQKHQQPSGGELF